MADFAAINPDEQPVFDALLQAGVPPELAYTAVRRIRELAAHNITTLIEAKFDAQTAKVDALNAKLDAQDSKLRMLMWMIGAAVAVIGILIRLWG